MTRGDPPTPTVAYELPLTSTSTRSAKRPASSLQTRAAAASNPLGPGVSRSCFRKSSDGTFTSSGADRRKTAQYTARTCGRPVRARKRAAAAYAPASCGVRSDRPWAQPAARRTSQSSRAGFPRAREDQRGQSGQEEQVVLVPPLACRTEHEEAVLDVGGERSNEQLHEDDRRDPPGQPAHEEEQPAEELDERDDPGHRARRGEG